MDRLFKKIIAVLLVITLAGANLSILGMYGISYALTDSKLAEQTTTTEVSNVEFNSYFEGGGHTKTENINNATAKLFVNIKVKNAGYLKNGVISLENTNFEIGNVTNENIQSIDKENNKILLKQLNNGSDVTIEIPVVMLNSNKVELDHFSKETKTTFTGTYIDGKGKEKSVSKEIVNLLSWSGEAEGKIETEITKYIPYITGEKYGVMVQAKVNSGIIDNTLPIKNMELNITVPQINNVKPTDVNVIATNTKATNGNSNGTDFTTENYSYDVETGIVKITVKNLENEISWLKDVADEYLVTFIFEGKEIYEYAKVNGLDTTLSTNANIEVYNNTETVVEVKEKSTEIKLTEKKGTMADFDISVTDKISKGQIYSNYDSTIKEEIEYSTRYIATINSADLTNNIEFTQSIDKFLTDEGAEALTTVSGNNYTYNKEVKINEKVFNKILGEEGTIDVYTVDKTKIGTINKETEIKEGNYVLDISSSNNNQLYIVTSKPITEGQLIIDIEKAIKTSIDYSKTQFKEFTKIEANMEGKAITSTVTAMAQTILKEPKSVAEVAISKTDLTTVVKNENVEIRATLDTSNVYNALYKNPTLKIKLPSYIKEVNLKQTDIVMANGLKIKGTPSVTKENGAHVINITLEGTQKEYTVNAEYKGTIIVLNTDLTVKTLTPSNSNKITMEFTNENEVSTNTSGKAEAELNFVAPTGIVTANGISNYAEGKSDILSISDKSIIGEISAYSEARTATIYGKVVNNYENSIGDVVILGRLPAKDNEKIDMAENMGSTFNTTLKTTLAVKGINTQKYTVYYSENVEAGTDLTVTANGWSTTATNNAKSYMIVTNDYEMEAGEIIEFSYDVVIPANLKHENSAYQMYKIYYNNISEIGEIAETKTSSVIGLTTGQGPELTVSLNSTVDTVREGQIIKMKVLVENTGSIIAENVKVNIPLPENTTFMDYVTGNGFYEEDITTKTINLGTIGVGKTKEAAYYIKIDESINVDVDDLLEEPDESDLPVYDHDDNEIIEEETELLSVFPKEIVNIIDVTLDEVDGKITAEHKFNIEDGQISLNMSCETSESQVLKKGDVLTYNIDIKNISNSGDLTNTVVTIPLANGTKFKSAVIQDGWDSTTGTSEGVTYNEETNTVQINLGTLDITKMIILDVDVLEFEGSIKMMAKARADGTEEHYSNITEYMSEIIELEVSELSSTPRYIKEGDIVTYSLTVKNAGDSVVYNVRVTDELPEELTFVKATYMYAGEEQIVTNLKSGKVVVTINQLGAGESTTIKVMAKAGLLPDKNDKEIQNKMTVVANNFEKVTTNTVTNVIEYYEEIHNQGEITQNPETPTEERYKITGTAWLDSNKNGKRDTDEETLSNISVMLLNKDDNKIVKDPETKEQMKTSTNGQGKYEFTNVPKGEYIVIFLYDASKYSLTTYQEKGVDESLNSDAISINITVDGTRTIAGTSDVVKIANDNIRDIDIGLYSSEKFDLKLDKYVSKITLTTPTIGTKTYEYGNSKLEKIEVLGQNLGKSNIVIEYKIVVTNEGAVPGYVKKIVDYLPEGVGFNTELNKDWYLSENGNVYNASLANDLIQPGESKEIKLIVTKKITEDSLGTPLNNNAEIYEAYNEQGLKDMDSTPGNKAQEEDDLSGADIILSIVTGKVIMYTTIILGVVAILGFGIYEIKRRVLKSKKN